MLHEIDEQGSKKIAERLRGKALFGMVKVRR